MILRFYDLGKNPPSLDWDEASLGYNAYSLLKTGKDEYGISWPLSIRSFGDYKPALYTYLAIPSIAFFGLTEFGVRVPSAVMGTIAVGSIYFLVRELLKYTQKHWKEHDKEILSLLATFLLAISPWHLQFSRVAFEANVGLTFFILGAVFFLRGVSKGIFLSVSAILFSLSLYAYHSPRLVTPVFLVLLSLWFRKELGMQKKWFLIAFIVGLLCITPLAVSFSKEGKARFQSVTVLTSQGTLDESISMIDYDKAQGNLLGKFIHNRRVVYVLAVTKGYLDHFDFNFLFLTGDGPGRHHALDMGLLYLVEAPFILLGIFYALQQRERALVPVGIWFLVAPLAASITSGTPHAVRAFLYLPTYQIAASFGLYNMFFKLKAFEKKNHYFSKLMQIGIFAFFVGNIFYYFHMYYVHTPIEHAREWQYGYKEAVEEVKKYEASTNKIVVTYVYDQPYIYFLFYGPLDPAWYQQQWNDAEIKRAQRQFGKFEFRNIEWEKDKNLNNTILVGTPDEIPENAPGKLKDITFPDGTIAFRLVRL